MRILSYLHYLIVAILPSLGACAQPVRTGADNLVADPAVLKGKRVGIICNQTSVTGEEHLVDALLAKGVKVTALFGPEHGIRGTAYAGAKITDTVDAKTGIRIYSLYGQRTKPSPDMLSEVDVLLFDIQDVGARFYTYAGTMAYAMEAAAQNGKKFVVLDRPNPINGVNVEGPVLDLSLKSLIGMFPVPIRHGLTMGELAKMIVAEGWIDDTNVDLEVIRMTGWKRTMWYDDTGLAWIAPSPNMRTLSTATVYPGTCLVEATNLSEGRGTNRPFEQIGGPGVDGAAAARELSGLNLPGVTFKSASFTPIAGEAAGPKPKHKDKLCGGVSLTVTDRNAFRPVATGLAIIRVFSKLAAGKFSMQEGLMDRLLGSDIMRTKFNEGEPVNNVLALNSGDFQQYMKLREKYLLYN